MFPLSSPQETAITDYLIKQQKPTSEEQTWGPSESLYPAARPSLELTRVTAYTICQTLIIYGLLITLF